MEIIPTYDNAQYRQEITLKGNTFILTMTWNSLFKFWTLGIFDRDLNPVVVGIKVVTQFNLTEQINQNGMPDGDILSQNIVGGFERIGRTSLGDTNELVFNPND